MESVEQTIPITLLCNSYAWNCWYLMFPSDTMPGGGISIEIHWLHHAVNRQIYLTPTIKTEVFTQKWRIKRSTLTRFIYFPLLYCLLPFDFCLLFAHGIVINNKLEFQLMKWFIFWFVRKMAGFFSLHIYIYKANIAISYFCFILKYTFPVRSKLRAQKLFDYPVCGCIV